VNRNVAPFPTPISTEASSTIRRSFYANGRKLSPLVFVPLAYSMWIMFQGLDPSFVPPGEILSFAFKIV
jgi:hypothetical protein